MIQRHRRGGGARRGDGQAGAGSRERSSATRLRYGGVGDIELVDGLDQDPLPCPRQSGDLQVVEIDDARGHHIDPGRQGPHPVDLEPLDPHHLPGGVDDDGGGNGGLARAVSQDGHRGGDGEPAVGAAVDHVDLAVGRGVAIGDGEGPARRLAAAGGAVVAGSRDPSAGPLLGGGRPGGDGGEAECGGQGSERRSGHASSPASP